MNSTFREYVTSGVFNLTLSRNMVSALAGVYCGKRSMCSFALGPVTLGKLERRGLIQSLIGMIGEEGLKELAQKEGVRYTGEWLMLQPFYRLHWPTVAGEHTVMLLQEAGLVDKDLVHAPVVVKPWAKQSKAWIQEHCFKSFRESLAESHT